MWVVAGEWGWWGSTQGACGKKLPELSQLPVECFVRSHLDRSVGRPRKTRIFSHKIFLAQLTLPALILSFLVCPTDD